VFDLSTDADAIIGTDFFNRMNANLNLESGRFCLKKVGRVGHDPLGGEQCGSRGTAVRAVLTVFSRADGRGRQESCLIGCKQQTERSPKKLAVISPEIVIRNSD
jgi:hypothetical protein